LQCSEYGEDNHWTPDEYDILVNAQFNAKSTTWLCNVTHDEMAFISIHCVYVTE
jgi:hypothetical protein